MEGLAEMAYEIGDPNHIGVHNALVSDVQAEATRLGVTVTLPPQRAIGDTGHTNDHNLIVGALQAIEDAYKADWGLDLALPDTAVISDLGHVDDHNLIEVALETVRAFLTWNEATGGTETTFTKNGTETWKRHTFLSSGTLTITKSSVPFTVAVVGGGAGGGGNPDGFGRGPTGGNGGYHVSQQTIPVGAQAVTVGGGGNPGAANIIGGGNGSNGGNGGTSTIAGQTTVAGGGQAGQAFNTGAPPTAPAGTPAPDANGGVTPIDHAAHGLDTNRGVGGGGGGYNMGGPNAGTAGAVVIEYRIV